MSARRPRRRWQPMARPSSAHASELFADISSNNGSFDAHAYASAGHLLIAIKATEGTGYTNPFHAGWVDAAHAAGLGVLHYHFAKGEAPAAEASHFWAVVGPRFKRDRDRLAADLEQPALGQLDATRTAGAVIWLESFDADVFRLARNHLIGYTFLSALPGLRITSGKWWPASWGNRYPAGPFRRLNGGTLWAWQFTNGIVGAPGPRGAAGIGRCDMSVLAPPIVASLRKSLRR